MFLPAKYPLTSALYDIFQSSGQRIVRVYLLYCARLHFSKNGFQGHLKDSRRRGAANLAGRCAADGRVGHIEVGVVEGVEHFAAITERVALANREVTMNAGVQVEIAGADQNSGSRVAEGVLSGCGEGGQVEPAVDGALIGWEVAVLDAVWAVAAASCGVGDRGCERRGEALSGAELPDAVEIPIADDVRENPAVEVLPPGAERQFISVIDDDDMS